MVDHHRRGHETDAEAGPRGFQAQRHVFGVHEVVGAEAADGFERRTLDHQAGAGDGIDAAGLPARAQQRLFAPQPRARKPAAQPGAIEHLVEDGRKRAHAGVLNRAVAVEQLGADDRRVRGVHQLPVQRLDGRADHLGVRVQEQQHLAARQLDGRVVGTCKTEVLLGLDEAHLRMLLAQHLGAAVERTRVDHDDLDLQGAHARRDRCERLAQELTGVPVHDDDRQIHVCALVMRA